MEFQCEMDTLPRILPVKLVFDSDGQRQYQRHARHKLVCVRDISYHWACWKVGLASVAFCHGHSSSRPLIAKRPSYHSIFPAFSEPAGGQPLDAPVN